jgi:hypothetical protein
MIADVTSPASLAHALGKLSASPALDAGAALGAASAIGTTLPPDTAGETLFAVALGNRQSTVIALFHVDSPFT